MADFTFYINEHDRQVMLETLLCETGLFVSPMTNYRSSEPLFFDKVTPALMRCFEINAGCYISGSFSKKPIHMKQVDGGAYAGTFLISENKGGPVLKLTLVAEQRVKKRELLVPSHLTYPAHIWNDDLTDMVAQSQGIKNAFKMVRKHLMKHCKKMNLPKQTWIGHSAIEHFESGTASLLYYGKHIRMQPKPKKDAKRKPASK